MRVIVLCLIFVLANATWAQSSLVSGTTIQSPLVSGAAVVAEPKGYADCGNTKYNHAYGENTIKIFREKDGRYLVKSSQFLKKDFPLFIKGWVAEKDCRPVLLKNDSPLEIESIKDKTLIIKAKAKLKINRIYFVSQELPSQWFRNTYVAGNSAGLSDEKKRKSTLSGVVIGTQIHANSLFRLSFELQSESWKDKLTSTSISIVYAGFASCMPIDALTGTFAKIDLCAKLLAGKSSAPNLHVKYNIAPQLNLDFTRNWRIYTQVGLVSVISRAEGFSDNAFGSNIEAGLAYRF